VHRTPAFIAAALGLALSSGTAFAAGGDPRVTVFYPKGGCETGRIEIEVFVRATKTWAPHPSHPQIATDTCQPEDPGTLLNELRLRCIDPQGKRAPSDWVLGADLASPAKPGACKPG
jgi:hypothetical protein